MARPRATAFSRFPPSILDQRSFDRGLNGLAGGSYPSDAAIGFPSRCAIRTWRRAALSGALVAPTGLSRAGRPGVDRSSDEARWNALARRTRAERRLGDLVIAPISSSASSRLTRSRTSCSCAVSRGGVARSRAHAGSCAARPSQRLTADPSGAVAVGSSSSASRRAIAASARRCSTRTFDSRRGPRQRNRQRLLVELESVVLRANRPRSRRSLVLAPVAGSACPKPSGAAAPDPVARRTWSARDHHLARQRAPSRPLDGRCSRMRVPSPGSCISLAQSPVRRAEV